MLNFVFNNATKLIFGRDTHREIGGLIRERAERILLHYGGGSIKRSGLYDQVTSSLREHGVSWTELAGVQPNPRLSLVRRGIDLCRQENLRFILAVGGGSVIDSAKAIAMGVDLAGDIWDMFERRLEPQTALPVATILTIPAAGSESSYNTVITNDTTQVKRGCRGELLRPVFSIINPELFFTLPHNQMAHGVCDMMSHIFERYFTRTEKTDLTDGLCESTLKTIMRNARILNRDGSDYDAWAEIAFAGNIAHNNLLGLGRMQDWACHAMEHELSALYDVPHGAGLAVITPAWMKYIHTKHPEMFVQFAANVMGVGGSARASETMALEAITRLERFFAELGLPLTLGALGIDDAKLEFMAKRLTVFDGNREQRIGNFESLGWEDILAIYRLAR